MTQPSKEAMKAAPQAAQGEFAPLGVPKSGCHHNWALCDEDHALGTFLVRRCVACKGVTEMNLLIPRQLPAPKAPNPE